MQIYCPNCHTGYQVNDALLEQRSRKLKCSNCGAVFTIEEGMKTQEVVENPFDDLKEAMKQDFQDDISTDRVLSAEPAKQVIDEATERPSSDTSLESASETSLQVSDDSVVVSDASLQEQESHETDGENGSTTDSSVDLEKIFERLSEHTEHLIETEKKLPFYEKAWLQIKNVLGFHFKIRWVYIFSFCFFFLFVSLYHHRYDVVRRAPFMNSMFKALGVKAKIPGEGLEFQNIGWEFTKEDDGTKLEIKGFIGNSTSRDIDLPTIHIEILDRETSLLQSQNKEMTESKVEASTRLPVDFIIHNPAPTAKYVYMTFIDKD